MSATLLICCVLLLATGSSGVKAASAQLKEMEKPFSVSTGLPEIFLGEDRNNPSAQSALRAKLGMVLDTVEAHYSGLLHKAHELYDPRVVSLLKDLLLMVPGKAAAEGRHLAAKDEEEVEVLEEDEVEDDADGARSSSRGIDQQTYALPRPLPMRLSSAPSPYQLSDWAMRVGSRLAQLPPGQTFPVLRRLLTAAVVRAWLDLAGKRLSEADDEAITGLFVQLYMLHRRGAVVKGVMDYQHVSKSGGTSWCHAAELNGCTTQRFDKFHVCGINRFEDKVRWVDGAAHKELTGGEPTRWALHGTFRTEEAPGCGVRAAQMRAHHWTYYSNEYTLTGGHKSMADVEVCSKQFVTAILFRNPVHRLASHLRFLLLHYKRFMEEQQQAGGGGADFYHTYAEANASFWQSVAPAITDNYFTRTLLGEAVWHAPVGSLTPDTHLKAARLVLMQFDMVVPLEAPTAVTSRLLAFGAGWPVSYTDVHDKNITALQEYFNFDPTPYMPSEADLKKLSDNQAIDMELYDLAVMIGKLDYLVYSTAHSAGVVPWDGMPSSADVEDESTSLKISCGLLRGPSSGWSVNLLRRKRRMKAYRGLLVEAGKAKAEKEEQVIVMGDV